MDVVPFFFWSILGFPFFGKGNPFRMAGSFVGKKRKVAWQVRPLCLVWVIWN